MASSSNDATPPVPAATFVVPNFNQFLTYKLDENNYLLWLSQIVPILKGHELMGIVDGSEPCPPQFLTNAEGKEVLNPLYSIWIKKDQCLLSWINVTLTETVLASVYGLHTSQQVWAALASRFASQSRSRVSHLKRQLQSLHQGSKTCAEYLKTAKGWANQLAVIGRPTDDEDLISYIISGLNPTFNAFVTSYGLATRDNPLSFADFQDELLNHETLLNQQQTPAPDASNFALFMQRPNNGGSSRPSHPSWKGKGKSYPPSKFSPRPGQPKGSSSYIHSASPQQTSGHSSGPPFQPSARPPCQICGKTSHQALDCFHRMDHSYQGRHPPAQLAAMAAHLNNSLDDQQWFADSGANSHITNELDNLTLQQQPFQGQETVAVGNGGGLAIENTGSTILHSPNSDFHLKNILHCPHAATKLLSIQKFCQDNDCYFLLTSTHFFVKDLQTHAILLAGRSENGLYPLRFKSAPSKSKPLFTALLGLRTSLPVWHYRLGHSSFNNVSSVIKAHNLPISNENLNKSEFCDSCQLGKSKRLPFSASTRISMTPLELVHTDLWTSPIPSISGCRYYIIFVDDFSRYTWLYPLHNKSEAYDSFLKFQTLVETQFSCKIKQLQSDGGGEFTSLRFQQHLSKNGTIHRKTCPHTSQQNGLAERKLRHILETGLTLLAHCGLSNKYWVDAFLTSVYIINRLPTPVLQHSSPYEKIFHRSPNYSLLRVFGCKCFPLLRPYTSHKLEYRSKACIFLGYSHAGYRCLDPLTDKVYLSRHVIFDEHSFPAKDHATLKLPSRINASSDSPLFLPVSFPSTHPICSTNNTAHIESSTSHDSSPLQPSVSLDSRLSPTLSHTSAASAPCSTNLLNAESGLSPTEAVPSSPAKSLISPTAPIVAPSLLPEPASLPTAPPAVLPPEQPIPSHPMVTRSHTGSLKPKPFHDYQLFAHTKHPPTAFLAILPDIEPSCFSKAALDPRWQTAMSLEFEALMTNGTWTLCPRPLHHNVIRNKWVYKIKQKPDGSIDRFKARLVAKGFEQQSGVDYIDTFSPVIKPSTIRIILAMAVHFNRPIRQLDVSNSFLHGTLLEEVYMEQPQGFVSKEHPDFVCKLRKSIYGLKQAPRAWFHCLSTSLLELGFTASLVESSLFFFLHGAIKVFMLIYVDDIIITGTHLHVLTALIAQLQKKFPVKNLGPLGFFLGIQASRCGDSLHLCQAKYIKDLLQRTHMLGAKPSPSPCPAGAKLSKFDGEPLPDFTEYLQVVGALLYCTLTRPEIAFSVNQLCKHMHAPSTTHWTAAKRVLRYLKNTIDHGLLYRPGSLHLQAFSDSDWAGSPDYRRSTSGFGVYLGNYLVSWSAKKQAMVSRSSTEAEYRSLALTTAELFWLRMPFKELSIPLRTAPTLWCDNLSALALASNAVFHARTKHIEVDYHFILEKVLNGDILIWFISTHN
jgi:hypothetical protein